MVNSSVNEYVAKTIFVGATEIIHGKKRESFVFYVINKKIFIKIKRESEECPFQINT